MRLTYTPLLQTQRDLYDLPRGRERFDAYLQAMRGSLADDISLPLSAMNPMAGPPSCARAWMPRPGRR